VIAAAGSGERLGVGGPKAFVELAGRPLLEWSLTAAAEATSTRALVVAAPVGFEGDAERVLAAAAPGLPARVVPGGASRAESVRRAISAVETGLALIHDAARPLVPSTLFDAIVARLERESAAGVIAATPIRDTVKRAREAGRGGADRVEETLARERLWAAQTPQGFRIEALRAAQAAAEQAGELAAATDEARLVESAGGEVLLEPAPDYNVKVTTGDDLAVAEALLAAHGRV
jgi:2-C-methyl-D-erythritol 4-phosphate cytidylyltransferase